jgi:tRNA(His) guanylyltransferase
MTTREQFMRAKEDEHTHWLDRDRWHVIRLDGRAFHTFTKKMKRPYDQWFASWMDATAVKLCEEVQGAVLGYVQSDEISVLVRPAQIKLGNIAGGQWFGGSLRKWLSISASIASASMTREAGEMVQFDSRVLSFDMTDDVIRYFLWRQSDAIRNAIQMAAQYHVGHKNLLGKDRTLQLQMMANAGVDFGKLYPLEFQRGRVVTSEVSEALVSYTHKKTGELMTAQVERNWWRASAAPYFDWDTEGLLSKIIARQASGVL